MTKRAYVTVCLISAFIVLGLSVIYLDFILPFRYRSQDAAGRILFTWYRGLGEQELLERFKIAARKSDWDIYIVSIKPKFYTRWLFKDPVATAVKLVQPDFIIAAQDIVPYTPGLPNYQVLDKSIDNYIQAQSHGPILKHAHHRQFDAFFPAFSQISQFKQVLANSGLPNTPVPLNWYPLVNQNQLSPKLAPNRLFYSGGFLWDKTRSADKYKQFFSRLDMAGYLKVCGPKKKWRHTPRSTLGFIPVDGISLLQAQHSAGISLILHSSYHSNGGTPTGRIFESAAANTVIISDKNAFVERHFGDSVLYIDVTQPEASIFQQIDAHIQWIQANPEQAQQLATRAHRICMDKFTIEQLLARIIAFHKQTTIATL